MRLAARRVLVSGAAASGKSTLAGALAARLGALHLDADDFVWAPTDPPFTAPSPDQSLARVLAALN